MCTCVCARLPVSSLFFVTSLRCSQITLTDTLAHTTPLKYVVSPLCLASLCHMFSLHFSFPITQTHRHTALCKSFVLLFFGISTNFLCPRLVAILCHRTFSVCNSRHFVELVAFFPVIVLFLLHFNESLGKSACLFSCQPSSVCRHDSCLYWPRRSRKPACVVVCHFVASFLLIYFEADSSLFTFLLFSLSQPVICQSVTFSHSQAI